MRRTGCDETPSMPVSSSALAARPPQPSWRTRLSSTSQDHAALVLCHVHLVVHHRLAAAVAFDAQEP
jgi:hypothetical protein